MPLTVFGVVAVAAMLLTYALEVRSPRFVLGFAAACLAAAAYGAAIQAWPFAVVEVAWSVVALRRWRRARASRPALHPAP